MMLLNKDTGVYFLSINFRRIGIVLGIGFIGKTARLVRGLVAFYGGGGKLYFGNAYYLRLWRLIVGIKLPFLKPQLFEFYWPKTYMLL